MDGDALTRARRRSNSSAYSSQEREELKQLSRNYHDLIDAANAKARWLITPGPDGMWMGIYPESTRTRDGRLGPARLETAAFFTDRPDGFVLPMAVSGGPSLLPAEAWPLLHKRFIRDKAVTEVHTGPMIPTKALIAFSETSRTPKQLVVDCIMAHVAVLIGPQRVSAERWAHLMEVKSDFDNFLGQQRRLSAV